MSGLWAKIAGAGALVLGILLAVLRIFSMGGKSERRKVEAATQRTKAETLEDKIDVESNVAGLDDARLDDELRKHQRD